MHTKSQLILAWLVLITVPARAIIDKPLLQQRDSSIKITLSPSRQQAAAFSDVGITAEVENTSSESVYLHPKAFTMTFPPEVDPDANDWYAIFPGCAPQSSTGNQKGAENETDQKPCEEKIDRFERVVELAAHSKTHAFWSPHWQPGQKPQEKVCVYSKTEPTGDLASEQRKCGFWETVFDWPQREIAAASKEVSFPVGKYTLYVVGGYWDNLDDAKNQVLARHRQTASIDVTLTASQNTILSGAAIGGVIAFLLLPNLKSSPVSSTVSRIGFWYGLLLSALLGAMVTILLSRLSETQFLIKVNVNDFWGAIAIGFVAAASGTTVLQKIANLPAQNTGQGAVKPIASSGTQGGTPQQPNPPPAG